MSWVGRGTTSMTTTPTMAVGTPTKVKRLLRNSELSGPSTNRFGQALLRGPAGRVHADWLGAYRRSNGEDELKARRGAAGLCGAPSMRVARPDAFSE